MSESKAPKAAAESNRSIHKEAVRRADELKQPQTVGRFTVNFSDEPSATIEYSISDDFLCIIEQYVESADYLRAAAMIEHDILKMQAEIALVRDGQMQTKDCTSATFAVPDDQMLNDFLMRIRPFLYPKDMFSYLDLLKRLGSSVRCTTGLVGAVITHYRRRMCDSEAEELFASKMAHAVKYWEFGEGRIKEIGHEAFLYYALCGGNTHITYGHIRAWLYGKKYHLDLGMFKKYRRFAETTTEAQFLFAARLYFFELVSVIFQMRRLLGAILNDIAKNRLVRRRIVGALRHRIA